MRRDRSWQVNEALLPFSDGLLSTRLWFSGKRTVASVPELGLYCYGNSKTEAAFRLFTTLLKYYRQLNQFKDKLDDRALRHLELLSSWVHSIEDKIKLSPADNNLVAIGSRRLH